MPVYISDQPDITSDVLDLRRRLSILENSQSSGGTTTSTTTVITGGGALPPGGVTYAQLNSDVTTTFDSRYVNVTGDSMSGSLTVGGTLGVTGNTTLGGSVDVATNASVSGNITVHGAANTFDAQNATIELGSPGISNTPRIDLHSSISSTDYDVRITASGGTSSAGNGSLTITATSISLPPTVLTNTTFNGTLHAAGATTLDSTLYVGGGSNLAAGTFVVSGSGGAGADPYPGSTDYPDPTYFPSVGETAGGSGSATVTGDFHVTATSTLDGAVTLGGGINGSVYANTDNSFFGWDGGSGATTQRLGFSKKSGQQPRLAYANSAFIITQYVGQTSINPANTQTDRFTIDGTGAVTIPGSVSLGSTFGVTGASTFTGAVGISGGISTKDIITGGAGAGIGNLASQTVDTYNIKDSAVTSAKLSPGALSTASTPSGTANNQRSRMLRYVTASASTQDAAGQNLDNLRTSGSGVARTSDSQAYGTQAIRVTASTRGSDTSAFMVGPNYGSNANDYTGSPGLAAGQYRATVYVKLSSAAASTPVIAFDVHDGTAGVVSNDGVLYTYKGTELSTLYVGASFPVYLLADTAGTNGLEIRAYFLGGSSGPNVNISHVTIEPWSGLSQQEVDGTYIKSATINDAHINTLSAGKITTGTLTADITQSGTIRTGPDSGARLLLNSGGLYAYSDATTNTVQILANGTATFTGTVNATGGAFTGVVTGGTFRGGTFETASGTTSAVRFDSAGIRAYTAGGLTAFNLTSTGALTATNATITGAINATSGTFTGTLYGTTLAGAVIRSTASIDSRNPEGINGTTDWHDISDGPTATITQQTGTGSGVGAGNAIRFAYIASTPQVSAPTQNAATANPTGGSFSAGTYFWVVTATNALGETTKSNEQSATVILNGTATISWNAASGATGYKIYRGTATNAENRLVGTVGATTTFTDTGGAGSAATPPGSNTTSNARTFNVMAHFPFASAGLISVGQAITWSFYARVISGDGVINPYIAHGDSSNVLLAQQGNITLTSSWVRYTRSGTALMTSDMAHETLFPRPNMQTAGTVEITGSQIEVGPSATPYGNGQQRMDFDSTGLHAYDSSGSSVTTISTNDGKLTANNITANSGTFSGSISAAGMTLTGGTFSSTSIQASTIDATNNINAGSLTSGSLSTARISVASGFGDNQILNGGFEDAVSLANWTPNYETTGTASTWAVGTSNVYGGANRAQVSLAINSGNALASSSIPVSAGEIFSVQGRIRSETLAGPFYVRCLFGTAKDFARGSVVGATPSHTTIAPAGQSGGDGAGYSDIVSSYNPTLATWTFVDGYVTVPTGATWMRVAVYAWSHSGGAWVGAADGFTVRKQLTGTTIADGAITTRTMTADSINGDRISTNTLTANKIATGTLSASTLIYVGASSGGRVEIDGQAATKGVRLYNTSGAATVSLDATTGNATFTGTVNATAGTFTGVITGGTFRSGTFETNSGTTSVVRLDTSGFKVWDSGGNNTINISSSAASITGATITGGVFQTAASGTRAQLTSYTLSMYSGTNPAYLQPTGGGTYSGAVLSSGGTITTLTVDPSAWSLITSAGQGTLSVTGSSSTINAYAGTFRVYSGSGTSGNGNLIADGSLISVYGNTTAGGYVYGENYVYTNMSSGYIQGNHMYAPNYMQAYYFYDANGYQVAGTGGTGGGVTTNGGGYYHVNCAHGFSVQIRDTNDANWETVQALSFSTMSSAALKQNVETHDFGLATIRNMRPVAFEFIDEPDNPTRLGLIAEEVEEHIPHAVNRNNSHGEAGVDYTQVTSVLIRAIQELDAKIEALEKGKK